MRYCLITDSIADDCFIVKPGITIYFAKCYRLFGCIKKIELFYCYEIVKRVSVVVNMISEILW